MKPQKITVKIPRKQGELIPFDLDKWNTGEYEAYSKDYGVGRVLCTDNGGNYPVVVSYGEDGIAGYAIDGRFREVDVSPRLFLRKKSSEELPSDSFANVYYDGLGIHKTLSDAQHSSLISCLATIHITYEWEDAV